ncbi:hypothetical protein AB0J68_29160, partial [Micromonospora sp. NPDC049580]|uniref:hypothetical protein n=1 Tax=Micromonospora sp. NPDC049580 TaxID=3154832 RepID=UPI003430B16C
MRRAAQIEDTGRLAEALDAYLEILAQHPIRTRCRWPVALAAAHLAYLLGCYELARRLAGAAHDDSPSRGRGEAEARILLALTQARDGELESAAVLLDKAATEVRRPGARITRALTNARTVVAVLASTPPPAMQASGGDPIERASAGLERASAMLAKEQYAKAERELADVRGLLSSNGGTLERILWSLAVVGHAGTSETSSTDTELAASILVRAGLAPQATRLVPDRHRSSEICWYSQANLIGDWAKAAQQVGGWLTDEDTRTLLDRIQTIYGGLGKTDPNNFADADMRALRSVSLHAARIGRRDLAMGASAISLRLARARYANTGRRSWNELAWALVRRSWCLDDAGLVREQRAALAEAAELFRHHGVDGSDRGTCRDLYKKIRQLHEQHGEWNAAAAVAVHTEQILNDDALPAIDAALDDAQHRARRAGAETAGTQIDQERIEVLRLMASSDPGTYATRYLALLLTAPGAKPTTTHAVGEALSFLARLLDERRRLDGPALARVVLNGARRCAELAPRRTLDLLGHADAQLGLHPDAEFHHVRAACLTALGRGDDAADSLRAEFRALLASRCDNDEFRSRAAQIADELWRAERPENAVSVLDAA